MNTHFVLEELLRCDVSLQDQEPQADIMISEVDCTTDYSFNQMNSLFEMSLEMEKLYSMAITHIDSEFRRHKTEPSEIAAVEREIKDALLRFSPPFSNNPFMRVRLCMGITQIPDAAALGEIKKNYCRI